jgi:cytochrome c5
MKDLDDSVAYTGTKLGLALCIVLLAGCGVVDGEAVYRRHCGSCHETGEDGAPALDHVPSWASRSPDWSAVLDEHAAEGFLTMPAKGGNPDLSRAEVAAAVDYMVSRIMPPSLLAKGSANGRVVYQAACGKCHDTGTDGAPLIGDGEAWAVRSINWHTVMEEHANEGFLQMPAKGEQLQLFSEDVAAAVAFMVAWSRRN